MLSGANPHHGINTGVFVGTPSALRHGFRAMINAAAKFAAAERGGRGGGKSHGLTPFDARSAARRPPFDSEELMRQVSPAERATA